MISFIAGFPKSQPLIPPLRVKVAAEPTRAAKTRNRRGKARLSRRESRTSLHLPRNRPMYQHHLAIVGEAGAGRARGTADAAAVVAPEWHLQVKRLRRSRSLMAEGRHAIAYVEYGVLFCRGSLPNIILTVHGVSCVILPNLISLKRCNLKGNGWARSWL